MQIDGVINTTKADCVQLHSHCLKARNKSSLPDAESPEAGKFLKMTDHDWTYDTYESLWRSASIVSLGWNLHCYRVVPWEVRIRPHRCYHSSRDTTIKSALWILKTSSVQTGRSFLRSERFQLHSFLRETFRHPFGFLQGDKRWWLDSKDAKPRRMEMEWQWMKLIMKFTDLEMNFVNQLFECKSLQVLCLPCHPWNSGSRPLRGPYDPMIPCVRLLLLFVDRKTTWSNWQTQNGNSWCFHPFPYHFVSFCRKTGQIWASHKPSPIVTCWIRSEP